MSDDWRTPPWLCNALGRFDLDPCSGVGSAVLATTTYSLDAGQDGLVADWSLLSVFCNPPFSHVGPWAEKLSKHNAPWCALVKLDPTTSWWSTLCGADTYACTAFRRRIRFFTPDGTPGEYAAAFPCALVSSRWFPSPALSEHLWL